MTAPDTAASSPLRVVLVDDQALVRAGFALVIDSQDDLDVVGQAGDGDEAVELVSRLRPDVVLMDVRMPRMNGIEATGRILARADVGTIPAPRIIVLTTFDEDEYALAALRGGASGFLLKDVQPEILLDAIRTVVKGGAVIAPTTTRRMLDSTLGVRGAAAVAPSSAQQSTAQSGAAQHPAQRTSSSHPSDAPPPDGSSAHRSADLAGSPPSGLDEDRARRLASLTPREREVLELVGHGMSNAEIVDALVLAEPTVKTHVGRILMKLEARDRVQAVVFAYDTGIVTPGS